MSSGKTRQAHRVVLYGPGAVGKTTLASLLSKVDVQPVFIDLEAGTQDLNVDRVGDEEHPVETWQDVLDALADDSLWPDGCAVIVDTGTAAVPLAATWTVENVAKEKGGKATSIANYGWGDGYTHVLETFRRLLAALDRHARARRHAILICHSCVQRVPNPESDDWLRYEPDLENHSKGNIRGAVINWADHVLALDFDVYVKDGKGQGSGTRTVHVVQTPTRVAKSRTLRNAIPYKDNDAEVWRQLLKGGK